MSAVTVDLCGVHVAGVVGLHKTIKALPGRTMTAVTVRMYEPGVIVVESESEPARPVLTRYQAVTIACALCPDGNIHEQADVVLMIANEGAAGPVTAEQATMAAAFDAAESTPCACHDGAWGQPFDAPDSIASTCDECGAVNRAYGTGRTWREGRHLRDMYTAADADAHNASLRHSGGDRCTLPACKVCKGGAVEASKP